MSSWPGVPPFAQHTLTKHLAICLPWEHQQCTIKRFPSCQGTAGLPPWRGPQWCHAKRVARAWTLRPLGLVQPFPSLHPPTAALFLSPYLRPQGEDLCESLTWAGQRKTLKTALPPLIQQPGLSHTHPSRLPDSRGHNPAPWQ